MCWRASRDCRANTAHHVCARAVYSVAEPTLWCHLSALFGTFLPLMVMAIVLEVGGSPLAAFVGGCLVVFDIINAIEARTIVTDAQLMFFLSVAVYFAVVVWNRVNEAAPCCCDPACGGVHATADHAAVAAPGTTPSSLASLSASSTAASATTPSAATAPVTSSLPASHGVSGAVQGGVASSAGTVGGAASAGAGGGRASAKPRSSSGVSQLLSNVTALCRGRCGISVAEQLAWGVMLGVVCAAAVG